MDPPCKHFFSQLRRKQTKAKKNKPVPGSDESSALMLVIYNGQKFLVSVDIDSFTCTLEAQKSEFCKLGSPSLDLGHAAHTDVLGLSFRHASWILLGSQVEGESGTFSARNGGSHLKLEFQPKLEFLNDKGSWGFEK